MSVQLLWRKAVIELHEKGYCQDFKLSGNEIVWLQAKVRLLSDEYSVLEFYRIYKSGGRTSDLFILGISYVYYNVKGILLIDKIQAAENLVIKKKLNEQRLHLLKITPEYLLNNTN